MPSNKLKALTNNITHKIEKNIPNLFPRLILKPQTSKLFKVVFSVNLKKINNATIKNKNFE